MLSRKSSTVSSKQQISFIKNAFLLLTISVIIACGSARKSFENKNFDRAFKQALKGLEKDKNVKENKNILKRSLDKMERETRSEAQSLLTSNTISNKVEAFNSLESLEDYYDSAQRYLDSSRVEKYYNLRNETEDLRSDIAGDYMNFGEQNLRQAKSKTSKTLAREAYQNFQSARIYGYTSPPIDSLIDESIEYGRMYYTVSADPVFDITYGWEIDRVFDNVDNLNSLFSKIYFEPIGNPGVTIDCAIEVEFINLDIDVDKTENSQRFSERVVVDYKTTKDTSGNEIKEPVYGEVVAYVNKIEYRKTASWDARVDINSTSKHCNLTGTRYSEEITDQTEEINVSGDERALPSQYKNIRNDEELMDDDDMAEELIDKIYYRFVNDYLN